MQQRTLSNVVEGAGGGMPDIENAGCLILWGYNASMTRLTHGTAVATALRRGTRLIVFDPRHVGLSNKADVWLRVWPGSDGALALGLANLMLARVCQRGNMRGLQLWYRPDASARELACPDGYPTRQTAN